jgi:hypothetical protein
MWKRELHHLQEEILERLRKAIGQKIVHALEFRVDLQFDSQTEAAATTYPADRGEPVSLSLDCIEDVELRRGFAAAASSYLRRPR